LIVPLGMVILNTPVEKNRRVMTRFIKKRKHS